MSFTYLNQGKRLKMEIEEFISTRPHSGRRGSPAIPVGTRLYAIKYENGGYFSYSYINKTEAEESIENSRLQGTDNEYYREWNVVDDKEKTLHYGILNS
jgi:hypothetical protein